MSSSITFHKLTTEDGIIVRVAATLDLEELEKYEVGKLPTVALSRNGEGCIYSVGNMHMHTCWPIHKTEEAAQEYGKRIYKEIRAWFSAEGLDISGGTKWKE